MRLLGLQAEVERVGEMLVKQVNRPAADFLAQSVLCWVEFGFHISEARLNHSAIHPEGGTVGRGGQRAAHVSYQIGHLFGLREPLQE